MDNVDADPAPYRYAGSPLTAAIAQELILELLPGKTIEFKVVNTTISEWHVSKGGRPTRNARADAPIGQALSRMANKGHASKKSHGFWSIAQVDSSVVVVAPLECNEDEEWESVADHEIGTGPAAIYVYFFDNYRDSARAAGHDRWACKIGRTDRDPLTRVTSQASTALPEHPHIALILRTSEPSWWESVLHGVLTIRGYSKSDSPGSEWFITSPEEVLEIIHFARPELISDS